MPVIGGLLPEDNARYEHHYSAPMNLGGGGETSYHGVNWTSLGFGDNSAFCKNILQELPLA